MAKEFFKDLPDTSTPLSATRINGLLDGEESMGSIVVEDIKSKNLFDKNDCVDYYYLDYSSGQPVYDVNMTYMNSYIPVKANEKYTMSYPSSTIFVIYEYDSNKTFLRSKIQNTDETSFTVTISEDTSFVRLACGFNSKSGIQFEKGIVATSYTNHINFDILKGEEWKELSLATGFENYGENYAPLRYKKVGKFIFIQGMLKTNTTGFVTIAALPETYRPKYTIYSMSAGGDNFKALLFQPNGEIKASDITTNSWLGIDTYFPID